MEVTLELEGGRAVYLAGEEVRPGLERAEVLPLCAGGVPGELHQPGRGRGGAGLGHGADSLFRHCQS